MIVQLMQPDVRERRREGAENLVIGLHLLKVENEIGFSSKNINGRKSVVYQKGGRESKLPRAQFQFHGSSRPFGLHQNAKRSLTQVHRQGALRHLTHNFYTRTNRIVSLALLFDLQRQLPVSSRIN